MSKLIKLYICGCCLLVLRRKARDEEVGKVNITFSGLFLVTLWGSVQELSSDGFPKAISTQAKPFMFEKAQYLSIKTINCHNLIVVDDARRTLYWHPCSSVSLTMKYWLCG